MRVDIRSLKLKVGKYQHLNYYLRSLKIKVGDILGNQVLLRNTALKDIYSGRTCFIIGNAPSLQWISLNDIKNELTFGLNALSRHPEYSLLANHHQFVLDPISGLFNAGNNSPNIVQQVITSKNQLRDYRKKALYTYSPHPDVLYGNIRQNNNRNTKMFLHSSAKRYIEKRNLFDWDSTYYLKGSYPLLSARTQVIDISQRITFADSSLTGALAVAMYTGCKKIILVGVGYSLKPSIEFHFYGTPRISKEYFKKDEAEDIISKISNERKVELLSIVETDDYYQPIFVIRDKNYSNHRAVNEYAESIGITIENVTPIGFESPVYKGISWDEVLNDISNSPLYDILQ
jgi:hypothetical protein